jgi:hypothetical protein
VDRAKELGAGCGSWILGRTQEGDNILRSLARDGGWGSWILGRIPEGDNMQAIMMSDLILTDSE